MAGTVGSLSRRSAYASSCEKKPYSVQCELTCEALVLCQDRPLVRECRKCARDPITLIGHHLRKLGSERKRVVLRPGLANKANVSRSSQTKSPTAGGSDEVQRFQQDRGASTDTEAEIEG